MASGGLPVIGGLDLNQYQAQFNNWLKSQPPAVEVLVTGLTASVQGVFFGYVLGQMSNVDPTGGAAGASANPALAQQLKVLQTGGPWAQARNLGVLTGVNAAMTLAIKKARNGKEDVWGS